MKKYKVTYVSTTDFLKWDIVIYAENIQEAHEIASKKGKILCITEITDSLLG